MIAVDVRSNIREVSANFSGAQKNLEKATERALNAAVRKANTVSSKRIRDRYNLKTAVVSKALHNEYASRRLVVMFSELQVRGRPIPLVEFSANEKTVRVKTKHWGKTRFGVSVKVLRGGKRKDVKGGFMVTTGGSLAGKRSIFKRVGKNRYPIKFLSSVSIPTAFLNRTIQQAVKSEGTDAFNKTLQQQLKFLSKANG